jgi:hypothetical protein
MLKMDIIPFLFVLSENIHKLKKLSNSILINLELEAKFNPDQSSLEEKLSKLNNLLRLTGILHYNEEAKKYLVNFFSHLLFFRKKT